VTTSSGPLPARLLVFALSAFSVLSVLSVLMK
jgi:hypothetical protein